MLYKIALSCLKGVGSTTALKLLNATDGDCKTIFETAVKDIEQPSINLTKILSEKSKNEALKLAEQELNFISKNDITPIFFRDKNYPARLKDCNGIPIILYSKGTANLNPVRCLSIVGTRQPSQEGIETTKNLLGEIAKAFPNTLIISGLAYGIDITAHKSALYHKLPTIAVLGHGHQTLYPSAHKNIAERIIKEEGALLTKYRSTSSILPKNFIERNTIVAAMADATLIIESKEKGGAMTTAYIASSYGREVLAVPGNIYNEKAKGCNRLIKTQVASLIENVQDIGYTLGWEISGTASQSKLLFDLSEPEEMIVQLLQQKGKMNTDTLSSQLNISTSTLLPLLTQLEFKDVINSYPGKFYDIKK